MKLSEEAREFLEKNYIRKYKVNPDGTVDVHGQVDIRTNQSKFPVKFRRASGYFHCNKSQLASLEGVPSYVNNDFYCENNLLTSLHDVHKIIKEIYGNFYFDNNPITNSVLGVLMIKGVHNIYINENLEVEKILNKYIGQGRSGVIGAQQELLDAGLDEYARL